MIVRQVKPEEYEDLVRIHLLTFKGFFLSSLGENFLKVYYKASLSNSLCLAVCAVNDENRLFGFAIGSLRAKGYHRQLLQNNFWVFVSAGIKIVFSRPLALIRLWKNLDKNEKPEDKGDYSELLSIAVLPGKKGKGIGKLLLKEYEDIALKKGCKMVALTTDYYNNEDVVSFYKRNGYKVFYEFNTYPSRKMLKFIKKIEPVKND